MGGNEIRRRQDEVKYDGYRMMLIREQGRVRLIGRGGHHWARRFPLIVTAALKLRQEHFVIDGETVVVGLDGGSDFGALHSGRHNERGQFYAFDMLAGDGEGQRQLALSLGKNNLARLLRRRIPGGNSSKRNGANSADLSRGTHLIPLTGDRVQCGSMCVPH